MEKENNTTLLESSKNSQAVLLGSTILNSTKDIPLGSYSHHTA
jgi:hypothetical protein